MWVCTALGSSFSRLCRYCLSCLSGCTAGLMAGWGLGGAPGLISQVIRLCMSTTSWVRPINLPIGRGAPCAGVCRAQHRQVEAKAMEQARRACGAPWTPDHPSSWRCSVNLSSLQLLSNCQVSGHPGSKHSSLQPYSSPLSPALTMCVGGLERVIGLEVPNAFPHPLLLFQPDHNPEADAVSGTCPLVQAAVIF